VTAQLDVDVRRVNEPALQEALTKIGGEVLSRHVARLPENENFTDAKVLFKIELVPAKNIAPRETVTVAVEVADVELLLRDLASQVKDLQGRVIQSQVGLERNGRVTARAVYDVPLSAETGLVDRLKSVGHIRVHQLARDPQAPDGKLALARLDVTLSNAELLVPQDQGFWSHLRGGLSISLRGLFMSLSWLIVGVLFVLPWVVIVYVIVRLVRRLWGSPSPTTVVSVPAGGTSG
jgi:hypothetical protein